MSRDVQESGPTGNMGNGRLLREGEREREIRKSNKDWWQRPDNKFVRVRYYQPVPLSLPTQQLGEGKGSRQGGG